MGVTNVSNSSRPSTPSAADAYDSSKSLTASQQSDALASFAAFGEALGRVGLAIVPYGGTVAAGADALAGKSGTGLNGQMTDSNAKFEQLLGLQNAMQLQSMEWNTKSNVSKTQHEGVMNAVRNVKA